MIQNERNDEMNGLTGLIILQALVFGGFCAWLAKQKNRDVVGWFILGALFSFIALIAIAASPPRKLQTDFREKDGDKLY